MKPETERLMERMEQMSRQNDLLEQQECAHDQLERSRPPNQKGAPHMLVCTCPKCTITC